VEIEVKDEYERYVPDKSVSTNWLSLKIMTRRRDNYNAKKLEVKFGIC